MENKLLIEPTDTPQVVLEVLSIVFFLFFFMFCGYHINFVTFRFWIQAACFWADFAVLCLITSIVMKRTALISTTIKVTDVLASIKAPPT